MKVCPLCGREYYNRDRCVCGARTVERGGQYCPRYMIYYRGQYCPKCVAEVEAVRRQRRLSR